MTGSDASISARAAAVDRRPAVTHLNSGGDVKGVLSGDALVNWVVKSCVAQRVPPKVSDPRAVDRVTTLLSGRPGRVGQSVSSTGPTGHPSEAPDRLNPIGVEPRDALDARSDDGVEHDGFDDRMLSVEI